jgi:hypothetical protein
VQQPLEAARRALSNHPANAGFLREDAYLVIVVIGATDEPSAAVEPYALFFQGLKPDPGRVIVAGVIGPSAPSDAACNAYVAFAARSSTAAAATSTCGAAAAGGPVPPSS